MPRTGKGKRKRLITYIISATQLRLIHTSLPPFQCNNNVRRWLGAARTIAGSELGDAEGSVGLGSPRALLDKQALESRPLSRAGDVDLLLYAVDPLPMMTRRNAVVQ